MKNDPKLNEEKMRLARALLDYLKALTPPPYLIIVKSEF